MDTSRRTQREKILIVDDSEMNRSILADMLGEEFDVREAEDGEAAIGILAEEGSSFSLVLLDIVMPRKNGFDVLREMNRTRLIDDLPVIMVSSETASDQIEQAYELGATDFIMRPFDASIVHRRVLNTILLYAKQKKLLGIIEEQLDEKEQYSAMMVDILSHIVEFRNGESGLHILHVRTITDFLLRKLLKKTDKYAFSEADISIISMASALHDIGKIAIDDKILNKPGKLTDEEFAIMKSHSMIGAKMLEGLTAHKNDPLVKRAYEICRWHHERFDGRGYPDGRKGDEIPISAQIVALADVYDALTSQRVYKPAYTPEEAKEMILGGKCGAFNPLLLEILSEEFSSLKEAIKDETGRNAGKRDIRNFADAMLHARGTSASDRTLKLLDYERMKFNFYAELTEEIQFEYVFAEDLLKLSPWGAKKLGVTEELVDPAHNEALCAQFGARWFEELGELLAQTTVENPEIRHEFPLAIGGEERWYDLIIRTIRSDDIPPKIDSAIGKLVDVHDVHTTLMQLKESSIRDPLTGLLNRTGVAEEIAEKLKGFPEKQYAFAVFDIDEFKSANDVYGHLFGDKVLCEVAERLMHNTRAGDVCARIGGDEFLVVFEYNVDLHPIIARIFKSVCGKVGPFDMTVSMGVAEMTEKNEPYNEIFQKADIALYVSKNSGRATYRFYDASMVGKIAANAADAGHGRILADESGADAPQDQEKLS